MYFNTFKTAISIQIAPTIKIRKNNSYFYFLAAIRPIHMPGSHDGSVSVLFSPQDIYFWQQSF